MCQRFGSVKISCDFAILGKIIRNKGRFMVVDLTGGDRRVAVILLDASNVRTQAYQSFRHVFCRGVEREVAYHGLCGL
jgi:hypothetical protein